MTPGERMRAMYEFRPVDRLHRAEFSIWPEAIERWKGEGLPEDWQARNLFMLDPQAIFGTGVGPGLVRAAVAPGVRGEGDGGPAATTRSSRTSRGRHLKVFTRQAARVHARLPEARREQHGRLGGGRAAGWTPTVEARGPGLADRVLEQRRHGRRGRRNL